MHERTTTPYEQLGGEKAVRKLVEHFYREMDVLPEARGIRQMHPEDLTGSKEKLFMFLTGWLGGPQLYVEQYGHPRLRARHLMVPIGEAERDQWLLCMERAMDLLDVEPTLRQQLTDSFIRTADHMRNQAQ
jgi:hemoglobin